MRRLVALLLLFTVVWPHVAALECDDGASATHASAGPTAAREAPAHAASDASDAESAHEHEAPVGPRCQRVAGCLVAMTYVVPSADLPLPPSLLHDHRAVSTRAMSSSPPPADPPPPRHHT